MTLPTPKLDDRTFQDLVDEAKRLIPDFCPEWTNHNLSDPGVALIEIFAWMTEIFLYRLNQIPDRFYSTFLDLVGIGPFAANPAQADLTFWLSTTEADALTVPAGVEVATDPTAGEPIVFRTDRAVTIRQPELEAVLTEGDAGRYRDAWDDLRYDGSVVTCFPGEPLEPGQAFYLGFASSVAGNILQLQIEATVLGVGVEPLRPPLRWEVWGSEAWLPCIVHEDTTGGLNRDGTITLLIPPDHDALSLGERTAHWLRCSLVEVDDDQPGYRTSPGIRTLTATSLGGTVTGHHGEQVPAQRVGVADGRPGQEVRLPHPHLHPRGPLEVLTTVVDDEVTSWEEVDDFGASGPHDHHVVWSAAEGTIRFGPAIRHPDGTVVQHGAVPPAGAAVMAPPYRHGGGATGNVGAGTLTSLRSSIPFIDRVENLYPATGGVDAETIDEVKRRAPLSLRTGGRCVTADDFERETLDSSPTVARARCLEPAEPNGPVRLLVVPRVERSSEELRLDDFALGDALVEQVTAHLEPRRVLGTSVEIGTPYYQGVTITVLLSALPGRVPDVVRSRVLAALHRFVDPIRGGRFGTGWPFDTDLVASDVYQLVAAIDGVQRVDEVLFFEADARNLKRVGPAREVIRLGRDSLFLSYNHRVVLR